MQVHLYANPKAPTSGFAVNFPYSKQDVETIKQVLGLSWNPEAKSWVSVGPEVLLDMERFNIKPAWVSHEALAIAENFRQQLWDILEARSEPIYEELYGYQKQGTKFLALNKKSILGDEMGTGKTKQSLDAAVEVGAKNVLVLAPKTLTYNWRNEIDLWHPELHYGVVPDQRATRRTRDGEIIQGRNDFWKARPSVVIANYEKLMASDWPYDIKWDVLICDEATKLKNATTSTWKNVRNIARKTEYFWALTGTPLEIRIPELYNIFALIRPAVLGSYPRFRDQHCTLDWGGNIVAVTNLEVLRDRIGYWMLRRTKKEVLKNLPEKLPPQNHFVKMTVPEQKDYQELLAEFGEFLDSSRLNVGDPLTKMLRMRQFCCTPAIWGIERKGSKYEELVEIIKEWEGRVLVFCYFTEVTRLLAKWLAQDVDYIPEAYIDGDVPAEERIKRAKRFSDGKLGKVFVSSDAGSYGVNITGADLVVHYDQLWNPQKMHQREDRTHRIGQENPVNIINLLYMDSIDYGMYQLNKEREQLFEEVVEGAEEAMIRKLSPSRLKRIAEGKLNNE